MASLGERVGILFKIKADSSDAKRELNAVENQLGGLGGAANALGGPTAIAAAGITAIATAATVAVAYIARLTLATSEFGSQLYDASIQTGLSAEAISALKVAADTSGSSLESVSGSVAKFNVLLGQAEQGNEKAEATLKKYGITTTETNEAFTQAVKVIGEMDSAGQKATAMMALFKDRTGQMGKIIDGVGGDFGEFTEKARKLGLVLSEEDLKAADDFGDTLDILGKQAAAVGQQFALELMPNVTHAMQTISGEMGNNQSVARTWGRSVGDIVRGLEIALLDLRLAFQSQFAGINAILGTNISATIDWANAILPALGIVGQTLAMLRIAGAANPLSGGQAGGTFNPSAGVPRISGRGGGGSGGGGGGGKGGGQDTSVRDAQARDRRILEDFKASNEQLIAENDRKLAAMEISEQEHIAERYRIKLAELAFEQGLLEEQLKLAKLTADEREEIEHRIGLIRTNRRTEDIQNSKEVTEQELKDLDKAAEALADLDRLKEEFHKRELKRQRERANRLGSTEVDDSLKEQKTLKNSLNLSILGDSVLSIRDQFGDLENLFKPTLATFQMLGGMVNSLAQGFGNLVQQMILTGSAGPNALRKLVASVLAGVAAQAAVLAIMETAYGIAALTPWGAAIYGPAAAHFKAAALFAIVAAGAALGGRAAAGNSFNQTAGSAGSGGGGAGNGASQQNNFTTRFNGFGNAMGEQIGRQNQVLAALEETVHRFDRKFNTASPGAVVMAGANEASRAIVGALHNEYSDNPASVDGTMRNLGFAR